MTEIIDNTELFKNRRKEQVENAPVCRVCGSKEIHTQKYDNPTMECIHTLRDKLSELTSYTQRLQDRLVEVQKGEYEV